MSEKSIDTEDIHVSQIDEYLASRFLDNSEGPLSFSITKTGDEGYIQVTPIDRNIILAGEGVDFELSSCEHLSLDNNEILEYIRKPIFTSSALELFDFLLMHLSSFNCTAKFTGNAWKINVGQVVAQNNYDR